MAFLVGEIAGKNRVVVVEELEARSGAFVYGLSELCCPLLRKRTQLFRREFMNLAPFVERQVPGQPMQFGVYLLRRISLEKVPDLQSFLRCVGLRKRGKVVRGIEFNLHLRSVRGKRAKMQPGQRSWPCYPALAVPMHGSWTI